MIFLDHFALGFIGIEVPREFNYDQIRSFSNMNQMSNLTFKQVDLETRVNFHTIFVKNNGRSRRKIHGKLPKSEKSFCLKPT